MPGILSLLARDVVSEREDAIISERGSWGNNVRLSAIWKQSSLAYFSLLAYNIGKLETTG